jgi:hypothetical protein
VGVFAADGEGGVVAFDGVVGELGRCCRGLRAGGACLGSLNGPGDRVLVV